MPCVSVSVCIIVKVSHDFIFFIFIEEKEIWPEKVSHDNTVKGPSLSGYPSAK